MSLKLQQLTAVSRRPWSWHLHKSGKNHKAPAVPPPTPPQRHQRGKAWLGCWERLPQQGSGEVKRVRFWPLQRTEWKKRSWSTCLCHPLQQKRIRWCGGGACIRAASPCQGCQEAFVHPSNHQRVFSALAHPYLYRTKWICWHLFVSVSSEQRRKHTGRLASSTLFLYEGENGQSVLFISFVYIWLYCSHMFVYNGCVHLNLHWRNL